MSNLWLQRYTSRFTALLFWTWISFPRLLTQYFTQTFLQTHWEDLETRKHFRARVKYIDEISGVVVMFPACNNKFLIDKNFTNLWSLLTADSLFRSVRLMMTTHSWPPEFAIRNCFIFQSVVMANWRLYTKVLPLAVSDMFLRGLCSNAKRSSVQFLFLGVKRSVLKRHVYTLLFFNKALARHINCRWPQDRLRPHSPTLAPRPPTWQRIVSIE